MASNIYWKKLLCSVQYWLKIDGGTYRTLRTGTVLEVWTKLWDFSLFRRATCQSYVRTYVEVIDFFFKNRLCIIYILFNSTPVPYRTVPYGTNGLSSENGSSDNGFSQQVRRNHYNLIIFYSKMTMTDWQIEMFTHKTILAHTYTHTFKICRTYSHNCRTVVAHMEKDRRQQRNDKIRNQITSRFH